MDILKEYIICALKENIDFSKYEEEWMSPQKNLEKTLKEVEMLLKRSPRNKELLRIRDRLIKKICAKKEDYFDCLRRLAK